MLMPVSVPPLWAWSVKSWLIQQSLGATSIFGTKERIGRRQHSHESIVGDGSVAFSMAIQGSFAAVPFLIPSVASCVGRFWRITNSHAGCDEPESWLI